MIIIHAYLKIKPNYVETFLDKSKPLVAGSQAEAGNISYSIYQSVEQSNAFIIVEEWKDAEALEFHHTTSHFNSFVTYVQDIAAEPIQVKRFTVSE